MRIAFLTSDDPYNSRALSGTPYSMLKALQRHCGEVVSLGPAGTGWKVAAKCGSWTARSLLRRNIDASHLIAVSKAYARIFEQRLGSSKSDVIFAPFASTELAFLKVDLPVVYLSDLTARLFRNYSERLAGISRWSLEQTEEIESRALTRADHVVYPSEWAANSAVKDYGVERDRISVIPFGANFDDLPETEAIMARRSQLPSGLCRLLFVGVDWERKGGDIALETMRLLNREAVRAMLTVVGCSPPNSAAYPNLLVVPKLDKAQPADRMHLKSLFLSSDLLLFPTRRDASPIVCCEAAAFGLPIVAPSVGGLALWDGLNGIKLSPSAAATEYAEVVISLIQQPTRYRSLAISSRHLFERLLNWDSWGKSMAHVFSSVLEKMPKPHQETKVM